MSNEAPTDALRLVPCPFCGGDVINTRSQEMTKGPAYYWHKCETCGAESEGDYGEDVAVAAWNRRAAPASPLPGGGWRTDFENAPKDGRWIVTVDKWKNVEAMRWSKEVSRFNPEQGERGWIAKNGYPPNTRPELCVEWSELPAAPTGDAT